MKPQFEKKKLAVALSAFALAAVTGTQAIGSAAPKAPNPAVATSTETRGNLTIERTSWESGATASKPVAPNPASDGGNERGDVITDDSAGDDQGETAHTARPQGSHNDNDCEVADAIASSQKLMTEAVVNTPTRTEALANIQTAEQTKGCLAPANEIIDLSMTLPTINVSWGDVGKMVREHTKKELLKAKQDIINGACEIANQTLKDIAAPLNDTIARMNDFSELISNAPEAMVGRAATTMEEWTRDRKDWTLRLLQSRADQVSSRISKPLNKLSEHTNSAIDKLEDHIYDLVGGEKDLQSGYNKVQAMRQQQANEQLAKLKRPVAPTYTIQGTMKDGYMKCQNGKCSTVTINEAHQIRQAWTKYEQDKAHYEQEVDRIKTFAGVHEEVEDEVKPLTWGERATERLDNEILAASRAAEDARNAGVLNAQQKAEIEKRRQEEDRIRAQERKERDEAIAKAEAERKAKEADGTNTDNTGLGDKIKQQWDKLRNPSNPQGGAAGGAPVAPNPFAR